MDNLGELSAMVAPLLNDPQTMDSLRRAAEQMGLGGLLPDSSSVGDGSPVEEPRGGQQERKESGTDSSADILSAVTKLAPLLNAGRDDDASRLLSALRPFLSQPKIKKLDEAEKLLSISRVLSIIKESKLI